MAQPPHCKTRKCCRPTSHPEDCTATSKAHNHNLQKAVQVSTDCFADLPCVATRASSMNAFRLRRKEGTLGTLDSDQGERASELHSLGYGSEPKKTSCALPSSGRGGERQLVVLLAFAHDLVVFKSPQVATACSVSPHRDTAALEPGLPCLCVGEGEQVLDKAKRFALYLWLRSKPTCAFQRLLGETVGRGHVHLRA